MLTDVYNSLTSTQQTELTTFRQGLRDLPASSDPFNPDCNKTFLVVDTP